MSNEPLDLILENVGEISEVIGSEKGVVLVSEQREKALVVVLWKT